MGSTSTLSHARKLLPLWGKPEVGLLKPNVHRLPERLYACPVPTVFVLYVLRSAYGPDGHFPRNRK